MSDWRPIETAPKDANIDLWCVNPDLHAGFAMRMTDCFWHEAEKDAPFTGWARMLDNGEYDEIEGPNKTDVSPWRPTHCMPVPKPPI